MGVVFDIPRSPFLSSICFDACARKNFSDDTAITKAVEKSTSSARDLLRIINQSDSGKSSNRACEEHLSGMSNRTPSDANEDHHSGMSNTTPSDAQHSERSNFVVEPFHQWLMTAKPQSKEEKTSTQSLITHRAGNGIGKENWDVINSRWCEWYKALMEDTTCTPTVQQSEMIQST